MKYDYIIIGAGAAGLSAAALLENKGYSVAVLEAHSLPGGCSSYFERDGNTFDAGATTLSGLKPGRPLAKLIQELDLKLQLVDLDPAIISIIGDKKIVRYRDNNDWIKELYRFFPGIDHKSLWEKLLKIEKRGWKLSSNLKNIPLRSFKSLFSLFFILNLPGAIIALPSLFKSINSVFKKFKINNIEYEKLLDEFLFITAQNKNTDTPLLMGAMGLCYPGDTSYAMGGMKAFSNSLAEKCSHIYYRHQVKKIIPLNAGIDGFEIITTQGSFNSQKIVSTLPVWNHVELFDSENEKDFFQKNFIPDPVNCWSAFMIYLTIPQNPERKSLYYQIHCDSIPNCNTLSFFVSLSHPDDVNRSSRGRQVVTISTHTKTSTWNDLSKEEYKLKKDETEKYILTFLKDKMNLGDGDLENIMTGTPKTFMKYTKRFGGLVGGIPYSLKRNPLNYFIGKSPCKNFFMAGDTQFPGQGIAAVILGSMNLVDFLETKYHKKSQSQLRESGNRR